MEGSQGRDPHRRGEEPNGNSTFVIDPQCERRVCEHSHVVGAALAAPSSVSRGGFPNNDREALKAIAPYAYSSVPTDPRDPYRGADGRPEWSIERIFTRRQPTITDHNLHSCPKARAATLIQNFQRFWTAPRTRAARYDPTLPKDKLTKPGSTRLPGSELSSREAGALHYLLGCGRLGEMQRSLSQLIERGAVITEKTYLSLCILARKLGDHTAARMTLEHCESHQAIATERIYSETIAALLSTAALEDAEAVALRATSKKLLLNPKVRKLLEDAGSQTKEQWYARWRLAKLPADGQTKTPATDAEERASVVITRRDGASRQVLLDSASRSPFCELNPKSPRSGHRLPRDTGERTALLRKAAQPLLDPAKTALERLAGFILADPHGHAVLQPRLEPGAKMSGFPPGETSGHPTLAVLRPKAGPSYTATTPVEAIAWHLELTPEEEGALKGVWVPLDQSVAALLETEGDYLGQYTHFLIEVSAWGCPKSGPGSTPPAFGTGGLPRILIACEQSLVINSRFTNSRLAHVVSADLIPGEMLGYTHLVCDVSSVLALGWCFVCAHPPCTHLCLASGCYWARPGRLSRLARAAHFFVECYHAPSAAALVENPKQTPRAREAIGLAPTCTVHPHNHSCGATKPTQLWLRGGLGPLKPSHQVEGRAHVLTTMAAPVSLKSLIKGRTFGGIARSIVAQYLPILLEAKTGIPRQRAEQVVARRLKAVYGEIGAIGNSPRPDQQACTNVRRSAAIVAAVFKRRGPAKPHEDDVAIRAAAEARGVTQRRMAECNTVWQAWKRHAELSRGHLFGTLVDTTPPVQWARSDNDRDLWMRALVAMKDHCLLARRLRLEKKPEELAALKPPVPPVRRVLKRYGKWWVWCPTAENARQKDYAYEWRRLPDDVHDALELASENLRPSLAASVLWGPRREDFTPVWRRLGDKLALHQHSPTALPTSAPNLTARIWQQTGTDSQPCPACGKPRTGGSDGCPRGLGALMCSPAKPTQKGAIPAHTPIAFVRARSPPQGTEETPRQDAPRSRPATAITGPPPIHTLPSSAARILLERRRPPTMRVAMADVQTPRRRRVRPEHAPPSMSLLPPPAAFNDTDVAELEPRCSRVRTHCAWLGEVHACVPNPGPDAATNPYLVRAPEATALATISDSGAAISLIGSDILHHDLPPGAIVRVRTTGPKVSTEVMGPNDEKLVVLGQADILLSLAGHPVRKTFLIISGGSLLLLGCDILAPTLADVCPRPDRGDGSAGYCTLVLNPKVGRVRLPLIAEPLAAPRPAPAAAAVAKEAASQEDSNKRRVHLLFNLKPFLCKARSERVITVQAPEALENAKPTDCFLIKPIDPEKGVGPQVMVAWSLASIRRSENGSTALLPVKVLNILDKDLTVPALSPLAMVEGYSKEEVHTSDADPSSPTPSPAEEQAILDAIKLDPQGVLTPEQKERARDIIRKNITAFAGNSNVPGKTHGIEVHLPLKPNSVPVRHSPPRLNPQARKFVREWAADLEAKGIIVKSNSAWGARCILVKKKDAQGNETGLRVVQDYRDANQCIQVADCPLPRIDATLDAISDSMYTDQIQRMLAPESRELPSTPPPATPDANVGAAAKGNSQPEIAAPPPPKQKRGGGPQFWCTLDLAAGFHGLPVAKDSQDVTAFVLPDGKWNFTRLSMGLAASPSWMVALMRNVMQGLEWSICCVYMDDILIWAQDFDELLHRLSMVLERLSGSGLTLKASKAVIASIECDFLGFLLTREGIRVSPSKAAGIANIDPRRVNTLQAARSFLGACSFVRKHLPSYSVISKPIVELTRNGVDVATESQKPAVQSAIKTLQHMLCTAPCLAMPLYDRPFLVCTDGSLSGLGACLSQVSDAGDERAVAYWGRALTGPESRYSITEIELLAVINCLAAWRPYLWTPTGRRFVLITDHAALVFLHTNKDVGHGGPSSRLQRWYLKLQEYSFEVRHRPGRIHFMPDFISRMQGDPELHKLAEVNQELIKPEWATIGEETIRRHREQIAPVMADAQNRLQSRPDATSKSPTHPPNSNMTMPGDIEIKEGGECDVAPPNGPSNDAAIPATPQPPTTNPSGPTKASGNKPSRANAVVKPVSTPLEQVTTATTDPHATTPMSHTEVEHLLKGLSASTCLDEVPAALDDLERQLHAGRKVRIESLEPILKRLSDASMGRRAAELMNVLRHARITSRRAYYLSIEAAHRTGAHLLAAPLVQAVASEYGERHASAKKLVQAMRMEFSPAADPKLTNQNRRRFIPVSKLILCNHSRTRVWCHFRDSSGGHIDFPGGKSDPADAGPLATLRRELKEECGDLPLCVEAATEELLKLYPSGISRCNLRPGKPWEKMHRLHLWVVALPDDEEVTLANCEPHKHHQPQWRGVESVLANLRTNTGPGVSADSRGPYADAIQKGLRRKSAFTARELQRRYLRDPGDAVEHSEPFEAVRKQFDRLQRVCVAWTQLERLATARWAVAQTITTPNSSSRPSAHAIVAAARKRPTENSATAGVDAAATRAKEAWAKYSTKHTPHSDEIRALQQADLWTSEIINHLLTEYIPPRLHGPAVARFVATCQSYTIRGGLLMRFQMDSRAQVECYRLAVPVSLRVPLMEAYHEKLGHPGAAKTYHALAQRCFWPSMRESVDSHVRECHECQVSKNPTCGQGYTVRSAAVSRPFDCIYVDVLTLPPSIPYGPHQLVFGKILIFIDSLSRFVETVNLPREPTGEEYVEAFIDAVLTRHGAPRTIACDRGSQLVSKLVRGVYDALGITIRPSTAGHKESQALVERYNRTINSLLRTNQSGSDWVYHVPFVNFTMRATPSETTKQSPAYLALGRELRLPADCAIFDQAHEPHDPEVPYSAAQLRQRLELAWKMARDMSEASQHRTKERRDLGRRQRTFEVGQQVLLRKEIDEHTGHPKGGTKLDRLYSGPFRIEAILDNDNVKLRDVPATWVHSEYHISRLRPWNVYADEEELADDEYVVEKLLERRGSGEDAEYLTKWRGYALRYNTWEPRQNLWRRCADMVADFDAHLDEAADIRRSSEPRNRPRQKTDPPPPGTESASPAPKPPDKREARAAARGQRLYGDSTRRAGINNVRTVPAPTSEQGRCLELVTRPPPPRAAAVISGIWHYLTRRGQTGVSSEQRWLSEDYFTPHVKRWAACLRALPSAPPDPSPAPIAAARTMTEPTANAPPRNIWQPPQMKALPDQVLLNLSKIRPLPDGPHAYLGMTVGQTEGRRPLHIPRRPRAGGNEIPLLQPILHLDLEEGREKKADAARKRREERMIDAAMIELAVRSLSNHPPADPKPAQVARATQRGQTSGAYSSLEEVLRYMGSRAPDRASILKENPLERPLSIPAAKGGLYEWMRGLERRWRDLGRPGLLDLESGFALAEYDDVRELAMQALSSGRIQPESQDWVQAPRVRALIRLTATLMLMVTKPLPYWLTPDPKAREAMRAPSLRSPQLEALWIAVLRAAARWSHAPANRWCRRASPDDSALIAWAPIMKEMEARSAVRLLLKQRRESHLLTHIGAPATDPRSLAPESPSHLPAAVRPTTNPKTHMSTQTVDDPGVSDMSDPESLPDDLTDPKAWGDDAPTDYGSTR